MQQEELGFSPTGLPQGFISSVKVCFDPDSLTLKGSYTDQLSVYRARKMWVDTLESCFLLDNGHDFVMRVQSDPNLNEFTLTCLFESACGRYAFWRLINQQAPEAQYLIETAHIPHCESRHEDLMAAPEMEAVPSAFDCYVRRVSLVERLTIFLKNTLRRRA